MGTTVGKLATELGRTKDDVLAACRATGVTAWSEHTPLDDGEAQRVVAALQSGVTAGPLPPPPPVYGGYPTGPMPLGRSRARSASWVRIPLVLGIAVVAAVIRAMGGTDTTPDRPTIPRVDIDALAQFDTPADGGQLVVGDCWDDRSDLATSNGEEVAAEVAELPCAGPHDAEVFSVVSYPATADGTFPGSEAVSANAAEQCTTGFATFVGLPFDQSTLDVVFVYPTERSWTLEGDRSIVCSIADYADDGVTYVPLTGTAAGAAR